MKQIPLTRGKVALVNDADYEWLSQWKWYASQNGHTFYAVRHIRVARGKQRQTIVSMHRAILGLQIGDGREVDHRDGNGLNNQRSNLRVCTRRQNCQSQRKSGETSRYKGVYWERNVRKWHSQIQVKEHRLYLGVFDSEVDAARAYDAAAEEHHGEFALTNETLKLY